MVEGGGKSVTYTEIQFVSRFMFIFNILKKIRLWFRKNQTYSAEKVIKGFMILKVQ